MLYAKLETTDTLYVLLHAEQVYRDFRLFDNNLGYYNHEIEENTISDISYYIERSGTIENIVIHSANRGRGVAERLVSEVCRMEEEKGVTTFIPGCGAIRRCLEGLNKL